MDCVRKTCRFKLMLSAALSGRQATAKTIVRRNVRPALLRDVYGFVNRASVDLLLP